jgi:hypothetical protein
MKRHAAWIVIIALLCAGCAKRPAPPPPRVAGPPPLIIRLAPALPIADYRPVAPPPERPPETLIRAEQELIAGDYRAAVARFDEFLQHFPTDPAAQRAQATRTALDGLLKLQEAAAKLEHDANLREDELARLRRALQASRVEAARAKSDLERLKASDIRLERRSP